MWQRVRTWLEPAQQRGSGQQGPVDLLSWRQTVLIVLGGLAGAMLATLLAAAIGGDGRVRTTAPTRAVAYAASVEGGDAEGPQPTSGVSAEVREPSGATPDDAVPSGGEPPPDEEVGAGGAPPADRGARVPDAGGAAGSARAAGVPELVPLPRTARVALVLGGNADDRGGWVAGPMAMAMLAGADAIDRTVLVAYNTYPAECSHPAHEVRMHRDVVDAGDRVGLDPAALFDARRDRESTVATLAAAVRQATADRPLYVLAVGDPAVVTAALADAGSGGAGPAVTLLVLPDGSVEPDCPAGVEDDADVRSLGTNVIEVDGAALRTGADPAPWSWLDAPDDGYRAWLRPLLDLRSQAIDEIDLSAVAPLQFALTGEGDIAPAALDGTVPR